MNQTCPLLGLTSLALLPLLAGCGHKSGTTAHGFFGGGAASSGNVLRVAMQTAPITFDPAMCQDVETGQMLSQAYEGLVQYDAHNAVAPCLAAKWEVSKDGLTYTFHLRPNARFQNGMPVTADDVAFSLRRALAPKLASPVARQYLGDIVGAQDVYSGKATQLTGVKTPDPHTVIITLTQPKAYWLATLTYPTGWIVCKAIAEKRGTQPLTAAEAEAGAGSGAFKITRFLPDQEVDMDANPAYWGGAPPIAGQVQKIILDAGTRHQEFVRGDIDLMRGGQIGDVVADRRDPALKDSIQLWPRAGVYYFALNEAAYPPFQDPRVRTAFAYATDRQKIVAVGTADIYPAAPDLLPRGIPGGDPAYAGLPYDPAKARAMLAAAGYPNGRGLPPLEIYCREKNPLYAKTADLLRQMYTENLGITVRLRQLEFGSLLSAENKNTVLPGFVLGWYADYLEPQDFYSLLLTTTSPENHTGYSNPQVDALCAEADTTRDPVKRAVLYGQVARITGASPARIALFYGVDPELVSPRVHGLEDCLMGHLPYKHISLKQGR